MSTLLDKCSPFALTGSSGPESAVCPPRSGSSGSSDARKMTRCQAICSPCKRSSGPSSRRLSGRIRPSCSAKRSAATRSSPGSARSAWAWPTGPKTRSSGEARRSNSCRPRPSATMSSGPARVVKPKHRPSSDHPNSCRVFGIPVGERHDFRRNGPWRRLGLPQRINRWSPTSSACGSV